MFLLVHESQSESSASQSRRWKKAPSAALGSSFNNKVLSSPWTLIWCAAVALCKHRSRLSGVVYFSSAGADFSSRIPTAADWRFPQQIRLIPGPEIAAEQLRLSGDTQSKGCDVELANQANHESPQSQINHIQASRLTWLSSISVLCSTRHPEGCFLFLSPCCSHYFSLSRDMFGSDTNNWDKKSKRDSFGSFVKKNQILLSARGGIPIGVGVRARSDCVFWWV